MKISQFTLNVPVVYGRKFICWFISCLFICSTLFHLKCDGQQNEIDSLKHKLEVSGQDTGRLAILFHLVEAISDEAQWLPYNEQMGRLSMELIKNNKPEIQQAAKRYYGAYYNNLGYAAEDKGNIPLALEYYYKSLKLNEAAGNKFGISMTLNNIGVLKNKQNDTITALEHFTKSLKIQEEINDLPGMALSLINIGTIYDNRGATEDGLKYYKRSLALSEEINDQHKIAMALSNIGGIYDKKNEIDTALFYYKRSLNIQEEIDDQEGIAMSYANFGFLYMRQKKFTDAEKYFLRSMQIATDIGYIELMRGDALRLSQIYAALDNFKEAYQYQLLYKQLADSINNTETRKQAVKKQMQYEYEKKEAIVKAEHDKEQAIASNEIKRQQQIKLIIIVSSVLVLILLIFGFYNFYSRRKETFKKTVEQVNNKALRSQMNPHFIFNSLNSIQDFINSSDLKNANTYIVKFAKLVRLILENSRKQEVLIKEDLKALELYMQLESLRLQHGFDFEIKIDPAIDPENTLIPPLIIQPFVENAIWHGLQHKNEKGKINIHILKKGNELQCVVEDNGVGREAAKAAKTLSTAEKRKSLGMEITSERIKLYNNIKNSKAFFEITDLLNSENKIAGMRVQLNLPFEEAN